MHSAFPQTLPWMRVAASQEILALIVEKGSICIDGISLTVAALDDDSFQMPLQDGEGEILGSRMNGDNPLPPSPTDAPF